jgi:sugar/nucleoside kinase (ribokinase family)
MDKRMQLSEILSKKHPENLKMIIGFDGFVDEIIHVVDKRIDSEHFTSINTIEALGTRIIKASGLSTNIELVPTIKKIGGNGPIMCNALSKHNAEIAYMGALGFPSIDDVFKEMEEKVSLYSFATNGHTDALEFDDGKLMLGKMQSLNDVTYENLLKAVGKEKFVNLLSNTNLFANVNWSMLPYLTDLWEKVADDLLPILPKKDVKPYFFIDLADPEKREDKEIRRALGILKRYTNNFVVVLGLNKKEAYDIANVLELFDEESLKQMQVSLEDLNIALQEFLGIDCVVIHPIDRSCCVMNNTFYMEKGPYIAKPKLSTGAGDNFNAGFMLGLLLGLTPDQALLTGMSTSGFYVRNAKSPEFKELYTFMSDWANDKI